MISAAVAWLLSNSSVLLHTATIACYCIPVLDLFVLIVVIDLSVEQ